MRCGNALCERRIFTERLPQTVQPKARRTIRLGDSQRAIGFAAGGAAGSSPVKNPVFSGHTHVSDAAREQDCGQDQQQELPEPFQEEPEVVWNGRALVRKRAVSTTVRTSASPFAAHMAR